MSDAIIQTIIVCLTVIAVVFLTLHKGVKITYNETRNNTELIPPLPAPPEITEEQQKQIDEYNDSVATSHGYIKEIQRLFLDEDQITEGG